MFKIDLDPGASQKSSAIRFAHRFAGFADDLRREPGFMRRWLYEKVAKDNSPKSTAVVPGRAVAGGSAPASPLLPGAKPGDDPIPALAPQVRDEDAARSVLQQHAGGRLGGR